MSMVQPGFGHSEEDIEQVRTLFKQWDLNNDGGVTVSELKRIINRLDPNFPDQDLSRMFNAADLNHDGKIDVDEFITWIFASEQNVQELMPSVDVKRNTVVEGNTVVEEPKIEVEAVPMKQETIQNQMPAETEPQAEHPADDVKSEHHKSKVHAHGKENHTKLAPNTGPAHKENAQDLKHPEIPKQRRPSLSPSPDARDHKHPRGRRPSTSPTPSRPSSALPKDPAVPKASPRPRASSRCGGHHAEPTASSEQHHSKGSSICKTIGRVAAGGHHVHEEKLKEERNTSIEELWETLLGLRSNIPTEEVVALFQDAFEQDLHEVFPEQALQGVKEIKCDLLTTSQVVAMAIQLQTEPNTSTEALYKNALHAAPDYQHSLEAAFASLSGNDKFRLETFRKLVNHMAVLMRVEEQTIISHLIWVKLKRFELTDSQYDLVVAVLKAHRPREHQGKGKVVVDGSDFELLCRHGNLVDPLGQDGISVAECYSFFDRTLERIESYVKEREHTHPGLIHEIHFCHHRHALRSSGGGAGFVGRTEMAIFLDEFYKCGPHRSSFRSPLMLCKAISGYGRSPQDNPLLVVNPVTVKSEKAKC